MRVGRYELSAGRVAELVDDYLSGEVAEYAFRSYDQYVTNGDSYELVDGDLLAPSLLGVPVSGQAFVSLKNVSRVVEDHLKLLEDVPPLADAGPEAPPTIGRAFSVLDGGDKVKGVKGVILSKVLHRKKPELIPVYDKHVWTAYKDRLGDGKGRTWEQFVTQLVEAMQKDLREDRELWSSWRERGVTPLRALDMVVWQMGRDDNSPDQAAG